MLNTLYEGLEVASVGITIVFSCLGILSLIMFLSGKFFQSIDKSQKPTKKILTENIKNKLESNDEIIAVISASIASIYSEYKIKSIRFKRRSDNTWQSVGRMSNMKAHQFDKKSGR